MTEPGLSASSTLLAQSPLEGIVEARCFDNGREFSGHGEVGKALGADTYFADPYASWQRGTNEWLNGRLRRYFPKRMELLGVTGAVTGGCGRSGLAGSASGVGAGTATLTASYWDTTLSGIAGGSTTAALQGPTAYGLDSDTSAIYRTWDDQDMDDDGTSGEGEDGDPWDFGYPNQHPILKYRGMAAQPQLDAQPDMAPSFGMASVAPKTFVAGVAIEEFQVPAAMAGNGRITYTASGLPGGLRLDNSGTDAGGLSAQASFQVEVLPEARRFASGWRLLWLGGAAAREGAQP